MSAHRQGGGCRCLSCLSSQGRRRPERSSAPGSSWTASAGATSYLFTCRPTRRSPCHATARRILRRGRYDGYCVTPASASRSSCASCGRRSQRPSPPNTLPLSLWTSSTLIPSTTLHGCSAISSSVSLLPALPAIAFAVRSRVQPRFPARSVRSSTSRAPWRQALRRRLATGRRSTGASLSRQSAKQTGLCPRTPALRPSPEGIASVPQHASRLCVAPPEPGGRPTTGMAPGGLSSRPARPGGPRRTTSTTAPCCCIEKAQRPLGYGPRYTTEEIHVERLEYLLESGQLVV